MVVRSGAYLQALQSSQWYDQDGWSMVGEAALQEQLEDEAQVHKQSAAEIEHCDHLLADAGLLSTQLLHLYSKNRLRWSYSMQNWSHYDNKHVMEGGRVFQGEGQEGDYTCTLAICIESA